MGSPTSGKGKWGAPSALTIVCKNPGIPHAEVPGPELPSPRNAAPRSGAAPRLREGRRLRLRQSPSPWGTGVPASRGPPAWSLWAPLTLGARGDVFEGQREPPAAGKVIRRGRGLREGRSGAGWDPGQSPMGGASRGGGRRAAGGEQGGREGGSEGRPVPRGPARAAASPAAAAGATRPRSPSPTCPGPRPLRPGRRCGPGSRGATRTG